MCTKGQLVRHASDIGAGHWSVGISSLSGKRRQGHFWQIQGHEQKGKCKPHLISGMTMCSFPIAAVTNYHQLSDLKQHNFIILLFRRSEVCHQFHWVKIKVLLAPLEASCLPWLWLPSLSPSQSPCTFKPLWLQLLSPSSQLLQLWPSCLLIRMLVIRPGPPWD